MGSGPLGKLHTASAPERFSEEGSTAASPGTSGSIREALRKDILGGRKGLSKARSKLNS